MLQCVHGFPRCTRVCLLQTRGQALARDGDLWACNPCIIIIIILQGGIGRSLPGHGHIHSTRPPPPLGASVYIHGRRPGKQSPLPTSYLYPLSYSSGGAAPIKPLETSGRLGSVGAVFSGRAATAECSRVNLKFPGKPGFRTQDKWEAIENCSHLGTTLGREMHTACARQPWPVLRRLHEGRSNRTARGQPIQCGCSSVQAGIHAHPIKAPVAPEQASERRLQVLRGGFLRPTYT